MHHLLLLVTAAATHFYDSVWYDLFLWFCNMFFQFYFSCGIGSYSMITWYWSSLWECIQNIKEFISMECPKPYLPSTPLCKSQWTVHQMALHLFCIPPVTLSQSSHHFMNNLYNLLKYRCEFKILIVINS